MTDDVPGYDIRGNRATERQARFIVEPVVDAAVKTRQRRFLRLSVKLPRSLGNFAPRMVIDAAETVVMGQGHAERRL